VTHIELVSEDRNVDENILNEAWIDACPDITGARSYTGWAGCLKGTAWFWLD
jgi:hypothetical protein